jgi:hypothetical protein
LTVAVKDATTNAPIGNVQVNLYQADSGAHVAGGLTDGGSIIFTNIPEMRYTIKTSKAGYDPAQTIIDFPTTSSVTIKMNPTAPPPTQYTVQVHVTDYDTGAALSGVTVIIDGSIVGTTDGSGNLTTRVGGWHTFRLELADYYPLELQTIIDHDTTLDEPMRKIPQGPWQFTAYVIDTLGFPIEGVPIYLDDSLVGYTDREGILHFNVAVSGSHVVKAVYGAQTIAYHVTVPPDKSAVFQFYRP